MVSQKPQILVIDDNREILGCLDNCLSLLGYNVKTALGGKAGIETLESAAFDLVLTDLKMPGVDGMDVIRRARSISPDLPVIVVTAYATVDSAVRAMQIGACDYITKPFKLDEMGMIIHKALHRGPRKARHKRPGVLIHHSVAMQQLRASIDMIADSITTVLIQGESGTGKELVAKAIHAGSSRSDKPFVSLSCAAFTDTLLMNELFGHVPGAYTGANDIKRGLIEVADGGTLFLDEIGETSPQFQTALLRVISEREITRVGDTKQIPVDFRLITATNRNLQDEVLAGTFREDLYYRLNVVTLNVPGLRDRREDISLLANHFLRIFSEERNKSISSISPDALEAIEAYRWPGNVRQIEGAIERAVLLCSSDRLERKDLPPEVLDNQPAAETKTEPAAPSGPLKSAKQEFEKRYITALLASVGGNVSRAASIAAVARPHLHEIMRRHDISANEFRGRDGV